MNYVDPNVPPNMYYDPNWEKKALTNFVLRWTGDYKDGKRVMEVVNIGAQAEWVYKKFDAESEDVGTDEVANESIQTE